ncbi:MAG: hypothetical protein DHS20C21_08510 [Gemmatimonadota bacterium]|nr:MAG: hypothetical protein DHS20C21_08510 [Gemmatimonadota bacterium]
MSDLLDYYRKRAAEYDRIYEKPERQEDLAHLGGWIREWVRGRHVLELACGTGWWTRVMAETAASIVATDANDEVLAIARTREYAGPVAIRRGDAFAPGALAGDHDTVVAAFWMSHLPLRGIESFLDGVEDAVAPGGRVILLDNRYVEGSSTPIARRDEDGNTYQRRRLADGEEFEVLKNFFGKRSLQARLAAPHRRLDVREWPHFWAVSYELLFRTEVPPA